MRLQCASKESSNEVFFGPRTIRRCRGIVSLHVACVGVADEGLGVVDDNRALALVYKNALTYQRFPNHLLYSALRSSPCLPVPR